jgi:hypothetical protein
MTGYGTELSTAVGCAALASGSAPAIGRPAGEAWAEAASRFGLALLGAAAGVPFSAFACASRAAA